MTPRSEIGTGFAQTSWAKNSHGWVFLMDLIGVKRHAFAKPRQT